MIRRPPRSTLDRSSAASDVYKRQVVGFEFIDAYRSALGEGDGLIIVGLADFGHGFFGEVPALVGGPFVVGVGQDGAGEADDGGLVRKDPDDGGAALGLSLLHIWRRRPGL